MHWTHRIFSTGLEWHMKTCISKLQGDVAGLGTTLRIHSTIQQYVVVKHQTYQLQWRFKMHWNKNGKCWNHTNPQVGLILLAVLWQYTFPISRNTISEIHVSHPLCFPNTLCTPFSSFKDSKFVGFLSNHKKSRPKHLLGFVRLGLKYTIV